MLPPHYWRRVGVLSIFGGFVSFLTCTMFLGLTRPPAPPCASSTRPDTPSELVPDFAETSWYNDVCHGITHPTSAFHKTRAGLAPMRFSMFIYPPAQDVHVSGSIARTGLWEEHIIKPYFLPALETEGVIFVDVGANVGMYSLLAAQKGIKTFAFEALLQNVNLLCSSVNANPGFSEYLHLRHAAVSSRSGDKVSVGNQAAVENTHNVGGTSFRHGSGINTILTTTLDDAFSHQTNSLVVMKVDVEGMECAVFDGAHAFLHSNTFLMILMEWAQIKRKCGRRLAATLASMGLRPTDSSLSIEHADQWTVWDVVWRRF